MDLQDTLQQNQNEVEMYASIQGAVVQPGLYEITENTRINDLIQSAGGLSNANEQCLNLASRVFDTQNILIPASDSPCQTDTLININTATVDQLQLISGIGPTRANDIILHREQNGPFLTIEDIQNVKGIGPATFSKMQDQITI